MVIGQKTQMTIKLAGEGSSHSKVVVDAPDAPIVIDEPMVRGGTGEGASPTETVYAALIGCTNVIGHKCANKLGVDIGHLSFQMEVDFDRRGVLLMEEVDLPFKAIRLHVASNGSANDAELAAVAAETEKYCPVSKLYEMAGTDLTVTWSKS